MKKCIFSGIIMLLCFRAISQDATVKELKEAASKKIEEDTAHKSGWKKGGLFTLNLAQGSLSNWQGGGDKSSFSAVGFLNLFAAFKEGKHTWNNTLDIGYGYINTTSLGSRKSDDRFDLLSKYGYQIGEKWYASGLFNFRTQFSKGYNYDKDANGAEVKTKVSNFLAPAYVLLSAGFDYRPTSDFSLFLSPLTERWILVQDDFLSSIGAYGVDPGKKSKNELGAFVSAELSKTVMTNVVYKSRMDLFSNYKHKPGNIDIYWTNILALKVNKFLSANIALDILYDDDAIGKVQLRQLLGIGFSAKF
ncbi:MAG: DUF3078 domain-containing protein [Flavitalea sp.]